MIFVREFLPEISNENAVPNSVPQKTAKNTLAQACTQEKLIFGRIRFFFYN